MALRILVTINCRGVDASAEGGLTLARMLSDRGNEVAVQSPPGSAVYLAAKGMGLPVSGPGLRKASMLSGLLPFRRLVRSFRPDVICTTRAEGQTACAAVAPEIPSVRVRCDIRKPRSGRLWRYVDRRTDLVVFPSDFMVRRGYQGERSGRVAVVPHPVDTDRFDFVPRSDDQEPLIVSVARLSPMKGHRTLIRALSLMPGKVRAVIAGPPSQQSVAELEDYASSLGVAGRLTVSGRVEDVGHIMAMGTIGVVTSLGSEVVSRSGLEMMSTGLPLLAAATNGLLDLVRDGRTGLLHSPGNHRQLAAQLEFLLGHPFLRESMGRRARKLCLDRYSIPAVGGKWNALLLDLAGREQDAGPEGII